MIDKIVNNLSKKYNLPQEEVLKDLIKIESEYHRQALNFMQSNNYSLFKTSFFLKSAGYLNNIYKGGMK